MELSFVSGAVRAPGPTVAHFGHLVGLLLGLLSNCFTPYQATTVVNTRTFLTFDAPLTLLSPYRFTTLTVRSPNTEVLY